MFREIFFRPGNNQKNNTIYILYLVPFVNNDHFQQHRAPNIAKYCHITSNKYGYPTYLEDGIVGSLGT